MSMAGLEISNALFRSIDPDLTRVVMSGDEYQLPSVDSGCVYRDIIESKMVQSIHLSKIHRQGADSGIVHNAVRVLNGKMPVECDEDTGERYTDCIFNRVENPGMAQEWILNHACDLAPVMHRLNPDRDIQVLSPGKRGELGTLKLNERLRDRMNSGGKARFCGLKVKDRVINRSNNYDKNLVNGDVGIVVEVNANGATIDFGIGAGPSLDGLVDFTAESGLKIQLAYCYTVHASQGSEFPCVILPISSMHYTLLFRSLLYTAMTRPSKFLYIVYEPKAMGICVRNNKPLERKTCLQKYMAKYAKFTENQSVD
jgi:exodeoxyribonuclease V alpha subunit